jgi:GNAT superfamily N-acetyltransferase
MSLEGCSEWSELPAWRMMIAPRPRRAGPDDIDDIVRVVNRAYRVEDFFVTGDRTDPRDITERMSNPHACFLVIDDSSHLAASVYVEVRGKRGYFGLLAVDPDRQGRGLARVLIAAVEAHCRAAGCQDLDLDIVDLREELPAFYARLGFTPVATAPFPHPVKLKREAKLVLMTKAL